MKEEMKEIPLLPEGGANIPLFKPHIPATALEEIADTLGSRWIGQGPKVERFEKLFAERFCNSDPGIAVGSGTDALHLAYLLAGVESGDEVITPLFTCTATNIPLLYIGAKPVFVDVEPETLNIDTDKIEKLITSRTKAIVCVHYGGLACNMEKILSIAQKYGLKVIEDAAHAVGAKYNNSYIGTISDFTMFSFQAIKHITTGDGGYLSFKNPDLLEKAKSLRWFGIDRSKKQLGIWENDITEIGYKYQMTDIAASLGIAGLREFDSTLNMRRALMARYLQNIEENEFVQILSKEKSNTVHAAWLFTIKCKERRLLQKTLFENGIESNQVHYRNDRYAIFADSKGSFPSMDALEDEYLVLPLHTHMTLDDIDRISTIINMHGRKLNEK